MRTSLLTGVVELWLSNGVVHWRVSRHAEGFRIETKIFAGEEKEPASKTTTLFQDGVVYDFLEKPQQTAVFRKAAGQKPARFILMND